MSMTGTAPEVTYGLPMINVVGSGFSVPYPVELIVKKKHHGFFDVSYEVLDVNGNLLLQVGGSYKSLHKKRIMRDPAGFPILTMRLKAIARQRWTVHRGGSSSASESSELLFTVQRSYSLNMKTRLDVFLASNFNENFSDFQVIGSCVYKGQTPIAEVSYNLPWGRFCKGPGESFRVRIYPGVDYAFIVALIIINMESDLMMWTV